MKPSTLLKTAAFVALLCAGFAKAHAQGNFTITNSSAYAVTVYVHAETDPCTGTSACTTPSVTIPASSSYTFTGVCTSNGAWKHFVAYDGCKKAIAGICPTFLSLTSSFVNCSSATINLTWIDEHNGSIY